MENTKENKAKFFSQYWGQKVCLYPPNSLAGKSGGVDVVGWMICQPELENLCLLLKPLSSISDEDSEKVSLLWSEEAFSDNHSLYGRFVLDTFKNIEQRLPCEVSDFLRSKGYALPYLGLSVEQQVEYGWVRLSE